jgi:hypothetical protein
MTRLLPISIIALVAAGLLGQFPRGHPFVGALHVTLPSLHASAASTQTTTAAKPAASTSSNRVRQLRITGFAARGASIVLHGVAPTAGKVVIKGRSGGKRWHTLAISRAARTWKAPVHLPRQGKLQLRVLYPDGSLAVGSIRIAAQVTLRSLRAKAPPKQAAPKQAALTKVAPKQAAPAKKTTKARKAATSTTSHRVRQLRVPRFAVQGVSIVLHGVAPTAGKVVIKGSYGGKRWHTLATPQATGAWKVPIYLARQGKLHLRVLYPDGSRAVGLIQVL